MKPGKRNQGPANPPQHDTNYHFSPSTFHDQNKKLRSLDASELTNQTTFLANCIYSISFPTLSEEGKCAENTVKSNSHLHSKSQNREVGDIVSSSGGVCSTDVIVEIVLLAKLYPL